MYARVLPQGRACTLGREVEIKINTKDFFGGWQQLALCTWQVCPDFNRDPFRYPYPQEYHLVLKQGGAIDDFEARFRVNEDGHMPRFHPHAGFVPWSRPHTLHSRAQHPVL